ncbi:hypothetical protein EOS_20725 [Caballeronia mineralivorans PML1(12)]|uniref:Uncharacterized protein n=1 Tax=Caballeronia mineralivorans PML1(12) TaxID=908627 RepID=A0A0J1CUT8_9BURK|nr:hypothetical protein EOS_20725 [Caballeronia mineralivorans PML1(12)]
MKRASHVPTLFKHYLNGGRATSATVAFPSIHLARETRSVQCAATCTASLNPARHIERNNVSAAMTENFRRRPQSRIRRYNAYAAG